MSVIELDDARFDIGWLAGEPWLTIESVYSPGIIADFEQGEIADLLEEMFSTWGWDVMGDRNLDNLADVIEAKLEQTIYQLYDDNQPIKDLDIRQLADYIREGLE